MIVNFIVYDATVGTAKRYGSCAAGDVALQAQTGEGALALADTPGAGVDHVDVTQSPPVAVMKS